MSIGRLPADHARADDLPIRKAGLWEMKVVRTGSQLPEMTMQHCTDETTDKEMNNMVSPMAKQICSKQDIKKTSTGYVTDSVCGVAGTSIVSHSEIAGDFNSAYTVTTTSHSDRGGKERAARHRDQDRGEMAGGLQAGSEAGRHRDAGRRLQDQRQGRRKAQGPDDPARSS